MFSDTKSVVFALSWWLLILLASYAIADDSIRFDVPVVVEARSVSADATHPGYSSRTDERLIEIVVPVSSLITDRKVNVTEFNFEVAWNRNVYPLVDYAPRTQTQTDVDGTIAVEQSSERKSSVSVNGSGSVEELLTLSGELGNDWQNSETLRFQRLPKRDLLVASGTVQRGTGAFFRFHPSRQFSLEGGRDLIVTFRVPRSWRGGVLKVNCSARAKRSRFAGLKESVSAEQSFVVATYMKGDEQARQTAVGYVQSEVALHQTWRRYQERLEAAQPKDLFGKIERALTPDTNSSLESDWANRLVLSGSDQRLIHDQRGLPQSVRYSAIQFARSRQSLYALSR